MPSSTSVEPVAKSGPISPACAAYDAIADLYARHWAPVLQAHAVRAFDELLAPQISRATSPREPTSGLRILDLCCGTGELASVLSARGHEVLGIDGSPGMIELAGRAAPRASFRVGDVRDFSLAAPVDAVVCAFDSLNHLESLEELRSALRCIFAALSPGGGLIFDLNMRTGFEERFQGSFGFAEDDRAVLVRASYDPRSEVGRYAITVFRREGGPGGGTHTGAQSAVDAGARVATGPTEAEGGPWTRTDVILEQRCFEADAVCRILDDVGFESICLFDAETALDMDGHVGRTFFTARRGPG